MQIIAMKNIGHQYGVKIMVEWVKGESVEMLLTEEQIKTRVTEIAKEITADFHGQPVTLLGTLKGSIFFLSDVARGLGANIEIDFIKASSYGNKSKSDGNVKIDHFPDTVLEGKNVIIMEDIIDSGHTAKNLTAYLGKLNPKSLKLCSLLDKPERREVEGVTCDYLGFTVPDKFLVGYGLDYAQRYRNLPYIGVLHFEDKE